MCLYPQLYSKQLESTSVKVHGKTYLDVFPVVKCPIASGNRQSSFRGARLSDNLLNLSIRIATVAVDLR